MDVFSRRGYAKANIREIAGKAGISVGGIYLYFKNKQELYKSLIIEGRHEISERIELSVQQAQSATQALSNFLRLHLDYALKHRDFILLHLREHGFTFGMNEKRQFFKSQRELIEKILVKGIRTGEFRKCNAADMAKVILGSVRGVMVSMALDEGVIVKPETMDEFIFKGLLIAHKKV